MRCTDLPRRGVEAWTRMQRLLRGHPPSQERLSLVRAAGSRLLAPERQSRGLYRRVSKLVLPLWLERGQ